jgi:hypothetical protein
MWLSKFVTCVISLQNHAGREQKSYKILRMEMFATLDKKNTSKINISGVKFVVVNLTIVLVTKLALQE